MPIYGDLMGAAPLHCCCRSDAQDGDRRRPASAYWGTYDLGGEEEDGGVQENGALTLDAWVCSEKTEVVGIGINGPRQSSIGVEGDDVELANGGAPARFLRR